LEAHIARHGELRQEIIAQRELRFDGANIVWELAGERCAVAAGAGRGERCNQSDLGMEGGFDHDSADALRNPQKKI
jgi:hypothetical protein